MMRRRALLGLSAATLLAGCDTVDDWFTPSDKPRFPGKREAIPALDQGALNPELEPGAVRLPSPARVRDWPQAGGTPTHVLGNQAGGGLNQAWQATIGNGGDYRARLTAQPVVAQGRVFTMDSNASVSAFDLRSGDVVWRRDTETEDNLSTNVGGGIGFHEGALYATTGRAELLRIDAGNGTISWRVTLSAPARSAPTIANGRLYLMTLDSKLQAFDMRGKKLWQYQAQQTDTTTNVLGMPAPTVTGSQVIGGFASGDLAVLQADTGTVVWNDTLSSAHGGDSLLDVASITGLPVVRDRTLYAASLGGILAAYDLLSGRRLWWRGLISASTPCLAGDWLFVLTTDQTVAALSATDGRVAWVSNLTRWLEPDKRRGPVTWHGPVLAGGKLLLTGNGLNQLVAIDAVTGQRAAVADLPDSATLPPVVADGTTLVITNDGSLTAFR